MSNINLKPVTSSSTGSKPIPAPSVLAPWKFNYASAPDDKDLNLLIMFHGLGDTMAPFANLGRQLNLPSTAILSLQAPDPLPLMETPSWSWYNTFTPHFEPLPDPSPASALPKLRSLVSTLCSAEIGWDATNIHFFGWGQGGTMALELALDTGKHPLPTSAGERKRLGSTTSICAGLISFPASSLELETPVCQFSRLDPRSAVGKKEVAGVQRAFRKVEVVEAAMGDQGMPRGREEWVGVMRFWSEVLAREEGWKGDGQVYEVVR